MRLSGFAILLALCALRPATAGAQQLTVADLGVRLRLTPFTGSQVTGTLFRLTEDTVRLTVPDAALFLGEMRKLEVSRGRRPNVVWGGLIGAGIGAVGGVALGALVGGALIYAMGVLGGAVFKKEAMGGGDVKLMAFIGSVIGWKLVVLAFFIAPFTGAIVGIAQKRRKGPDTIPYGPHLALAAVIAIFIGNSIIHFIVTGTI